MTISRAFLVTLAALVASPAMAGTVRLSNERGGTITLHVLRYQQLAASGDQVVLERICQSACTMILGIVPRERLCATPGTVFRFHAANYRSRDGIRSQNDSYTQVMANYWPANVKAWVARHKATATLEFTNATPGELGVRTCR